ncbi:MAG: HAD hydrolase-like protein [Nannocystis sp.]|nr:HAD hydrolase-like protein [Nannocystis sp.]
MEITTILFDLDGVLIDPLASISSSLNHALASLGRPPRPSEALRGLIGPPLEQSAHVLLDSDDPDLIDRFITAYRARYALICERESAPAPGLCESLEALSGRLRGRMAVATHKPERFARMILEALAVARFFSAICGGDERRRGDTKAAIIGRALASLGVGPAGAVMVGDRSFDVLGAAAHGIPTIGVLAGMGSRAELEAAGARWFIEDLRGLPALIEALSAEPKPPTAGRAG